MIVLIRCDDRLIHGQIMTRIVQHYFVKKIIAIDDFTANNAILKSIFEKAVPPSMTAKVVTVEGSYDEIEKAINDSEKTLILCRTPVVARDLFEKHVNLPKSLMIGPVASKSNSVAYSFGSYLNEAEVNACEAMLKQGIEVFFQVVPDQKRTDWNDAKQNIK